MFSSRLPAHLASNAITRAAESLRTRGVPLLDLTESNPTRVGLAYPPGLLAVLSDPAGLVYRPEPLGLPSAQAGVARYITSSRGVEIDPARLVLSASTSEAYGWLFKLLCEPGDEVLVPAPSYPLFDSLASLEAVHLSAYRLDYHGVWSIDRESLTQRLTSRTRAILVVSPNNPTGSRLRDGDREWLIGVAATHGLALISDEVFAEYPLRPAPDASSLHETTGALTFVLGGLSKSAALPQLKLAWTMVSGPPALVDEALTRLEIIADTYLSVSTPIQLAAPALLDDTHSLRAQIQARLETNLTCLEAMTAGSPVTLLRPEGGWSAVLRLPAIEPEEALVLRLIDEDHVLVHPGYFFDFDTEAWLVVSLLPEPERFRDAIRRVVARAGTLAVS